MCHCFCCWMIDISVRASRAMRYVRSCQPTLPCISFQHILSHHLPLPHTTYSHHLLTPPSLVPLQAKERQIEEWSGADSPVSELMRTLQDNRRLSTELADARAQLSAMDVFNSKNGTHIHPYLLRLTRLDSKINLTGSTPTVTLIYS